MLSFTGFEWEASVGTPARPLSNPKEIVDACAALRWDAAQLADPKWFTPTIQDLHDPFLMHGMDTVVQRLKSALASNQRIRIITDYDVDGTTSSLVLQATLRILNPTVDLDYHIPNRFKEGYGFSTIAAQKAVDDGIDLIITADIGIRDQAAVDIARNGGVDVFILDHHLPAGADVPKGALVLCPPQNACNYPNPGLCACGVSLKLAQAMLHHHPKFSAIFQSMLKLAAIGTVADMVPLNSRENRAIVILGLRALNTGTHNAGLDALLKLSKSTPGELDEGTIGYQIGPRINAAGRMADANIVVELLNTKNRQQAQEYAHRIESFNQERRQVQARLVAQALEQIETPKPPFALVWGTEEQGWHRGVVGIVASKIMYQLHRPAAVVSIQGDTAVGSMRSIDGVHCVQLLTEAKDLLEKFGGHPKAAGFTLKTKNLDAFKIKMTEAVQRMASGEHLLPRHQYSVELAPEGLQVALPDTLKTIGPFGIGNERHRFLLRAVTPTRVRTMSQGKHLKFQLQFATGVSDAIWWNEGSREAEFEGATVDLLGTVDINSWQGRRSVQFLIEDARPTLPQ